MHDIICPYCGEKYLGCDVVFDISNFVIPLLAHPDLSDDEIEEVGFKYYIDEEDILKTASESNETLIRCNAAGGPGQDGAYFPFVVTSRMLIMYIADRLYKSFEEFNGFLSNLSDANVNNRRIKCDAVQFATIKKIYDLFEVSKKSGSNVSVDDENMQIVLKILLHLFDNIYNASESVRIDLSIYSNSSQINPEYDIPDTLFIRDGNALVRRSKCCRFCGTKLPMEFGYYRMKPVVLLGSHFSGKTSFLLGMLYTVQNIPPFTYNADTNLNLSADVLLDDINYEAFRKSVETFKSGGTPDKTDFVNVPVLNLKIRDVIYSFIDWPGEKFIDNSGKVDQDYIAGYRRVITHASHLFFFLEPTQIDRTMRTADGENVQFDTTDLINSLRIHLAYITKERLRSITYIVNKVDMFSKGDRGAIAIENKIRNLNEIDFYKDSCFDMRRLGDTSKELSDYIKSKDMQLFNGLYGADGALNLEKCFIPVAPYGCNATDSETDGGYIVHRTRLAGLPLLRILKSDKFIQ